MLAMSNAKPRDATGSGEPTPRHTRRSERHEEEIAKLLADVKLHSRPAARPGPEQAAGSVLRSTRPGTDPGPKRMSAGLTPRTASADRVPQRWFADVSESMETDEPASPSAAAQQRRIGQRRSWTPASRTASARTAVPATDAGAGEPVDLDGMSYTAAGGDGRGWTRQTLPANLSSVLGKQTPRTPRHARCRSFGAGASAERLTTPARTPGSLAAPPEEEEEDAPHTRNLRQAMDLLIQQQGGAEDAQDMLAELQAAVELAGTVNLGLRRAIRRSLEARMSLVLQRDDAMADALIGPLDADLSELLKYSDDHMRRFTDTLILLSRRPPGAARSPRMPPPSAMRGMRTNISPGARSMTDSPAARLGAHRSPLPSARATSYPASSGTSATSEAEGPPAHPLRYRIAPPRPPAPLSSLQLGYRWAPGTHVTESTPHISDALSRAAHAPDQSFGID